MQDKKAARVMSWGYPLLMTKEEQRELEERPPGTKQWAFTEAQFVVRLRIAQKFCRSLLLADDAQTRVLRRAFEVFPLWGFYKMRDTGRLVRIIDIQQEWPRVPTAKVVICSLAHSSCPRRGVGLHELKQVERWTKEDLEQIRWNDNPGGFADPLGFECLQEVGRK